MVTHFVAAAKDGHSSACQILVRRVIGELRSCHIGEATNTLPHYNSLSFPPFTTLALSGACSGSRVASISGQALQLARGVLVLGALGCGSRQD